MPRSFGHSQLVRWPFMHDCPLLNTLIAVAESTCLAWPNQAPCAQLDDTLDHWDATPHLKERKAFVKRLQHLARARGLRVSFISGDVHVCAVGRLYSRPKARCSTWCQGFGEH